MYSSDRLSDNRLLQRFGLATLYYSTDSDNWSNDGGWLKSTNECDWEIYDYICSQESAVQAVYLSSDNLFGRIPIEIGLLTQLTHFELDYNQLTGPLPSEIGILTQLNDLSLYNNELTGSIPSELALLTQLTSLFPNRNELTDIIPPELGILNQLMVLYLDRNELMGSMPISLCSAGLFIVIDCEEIACMCCHTPSNAGGASCPSD